MKAFYHDIEQCKQALLAGGVVLYPTDTIWGLGCLATNDTAIRKIYSIKQRPLDKKLIVLVKDIFMLQQYVGTLKEEEIEVIEKSEKPTTIIYSNVSGLSHLLISDTGTAAIRVVRDEFCKELINTCDAAITSTSANISDAPNPVSFAEIDNEIRKNVDYVVKYKQEESIKSNPSRILILNNGSWTVIRD